MAKFEFLVGMHKLVGKHDTNLQQDCGKRPGMLPASYDH